MASSYVEWNISLTKIIYVIMFRMDFNGMYTEQINMDDTILYT